MLVDAGAEAQRLAPGVEAEDLVALDAPDLEAEAVRSQVDDGERLGPDGLEGAREGVQHGRVGERQPYGAARSLAESFAAP